MDIDRRLRIKSGRGMASRMMGLAQGSQGIRANLGRCILEHSTIAARPWCGLLAVAASRIFGSIVFRSFKSVGQRPGKIMLRCRWRGVRRARHLLLVKDGLLRLGRHLSRMLCRLVRWLGRIRFGIGFDKGRLQVR